MAEDFEEIKEELIEFLTGEQRERITLSNRSKTELVQFIKVFEILYKKEFYSDVLSNSLLRKFSFDKEFNEVIQVMKGKEVAQAEETFGVTKTAAQKILEAVKTEQGNEALQPWNTMQVAFAYHSKDQDVIFNQIKTNEIDWMMFQKLSIPIWLKDTDKLKNLIEGVAKTVYRKAGEEVGLSSRAAETAMWYILINKKSILCALYRTEPNNKKVYEMLMNDFTVDKWKKAADKNAMKLVSLKKYELAIAFFILGEKTLDAVNVALNKLKDLNLAILIARLVEGYDSDAVKNLIDKYLIETGKIVEDPWLVSIGHWWKGQHFDAINELSLMIGETKQRLAK